MSNDLQGHRSSYQDLASWLQYIESLHPKSIAMGLERITSTRPLKLLPLLARTAKAQLVRC